MPESEESQSREWTPELIRQLRGKRTLEEFGALLEAPKNTIWRWEAGMVKPGRNLSARLSGLADTEGFLSNWSLAGSMTLVGDLDGADAEIRGLMESAIQNSARELAG